MNKKATAFLLICLITLLLSFVYSFFLPFNTFLGNYSITILTLIFFFFGALGFGFLSFIPHLFLGLAFGAKKNANLFVYLLPIILATYAGLSLGAILLDDLNNKKYFLKEIKPIISILFVAIILSIGIEMLLPMLINSGIIPTEVLGMKLNEGESSAGLFDELLSQK